MKERTVDGTTYLTVEAAGDIVGWYVLAVEAWKPGVLRLHLRYGDDRRSLFRLVYCPEAVFEAAYGAILRYAREEGAHAT